jgi:xanthine dehydrogenase small subunit
LDGKINTLDFSKQHFGPTTTVLNYLRSLSDHKGVKEGCAEGDCGACTVVIASYENNSLVYKAVNSCLIFLPQIHGKQLITVENLATKEDKKILLHPVQQAMVDTNGSQCGYCTPGFIMSMFAFYKSHNNPNREFIEDALTGNLCRCTGYEPIIKALQKACTNKQEDKFNRNEAELISQLNAINNQAFPLELRTSSQTYLQPKSLSELFIFWNNYPEAIIINGSTDIAIKQTKKFEQLETIIDLSAISELKNYEENHNEVIIGSGISLEMLKFSIKNTFPEFHHLLEVFASKQIRELATLGGNIGSASPIGDTLPLLMAMNAKLVLLSKSGNRYLSMDDFIIGYRKTALKKQEIIQSIRIPKTNNIISRFYKVSKRKDLDIATVSAGFSISLNGKIVKDICIAYGGMAEMPKRAKKTESFLTDTNWDIQTIMEAQEILENEFHPISDARSGAEFRRMAAKNLLLKLYNDTRYE